MLEEIMNTVADKPIMSGFVVIITFLALRGLVRGPKERRPKYRTCSCGGTGYVSAGVHCARCKGTGDGYYL